MKKLQVTSHKSQVNQRGFTLVEMLIAVGLFVVIATFSLGAVVSIFDANRKAQASKTVVDNINLSIESMVRTIRFGDHYYCGVSSTNIVGDCPSGGSNSVSVTFGTRIVYRLNGTAIQRSDDGGVNYINITSSDTVIDYLNFTVVGSAPHDLAQPYVRIVLKGHVGTKSSIQTDFSIETLASQRALDI